MAVIGTRLLVLMVALTLGNFIGQAILSHDWQRAVERSVFQAIALFCVWLNFRWDAW